MLKNLKKIALVALSLTAVMPAAAQDLLANQAPIDRKMRAIDSIQLNQMLESEVVQQSSVAQLYDDWNNMYSSHQTTLPDSLLIDLRDFAMPTPSRIITSNFGARWGRQHKGLDIKLNTGDTIVAAFSGKVRIVRFEPKGYGKYVVIRHPNGLETIYGHMSKQLVSENQEVRAGEPIGLGGSTGRSTGSHLHFETRLCGTALNPALMFDFHNQDVVGDYYMFRKATYNKESIVATRLRGVSGQGGEDPTDYAQLAKQKSQKQSKQTARSSRKQSQQGAYHKVQRGETLSAIARRHGTTVDAICKLNRITKKTVLKPGQILKYN
ncbi:MAG: peptidoglycan DD-metalloendopeptidase family protein [Prevotella sp.]|jgi:murein DD-endopeptidase MepM/ murein hydrolase activator NlpD|nr:peptidoglycan DD-metalloendopeptidase family protein [Prevotella sp.]